MIQTDEEIIARHDESVRGRAAIELAIVHELIKRLVAAGYKVYVDDGDDELQNGEEQELVTAIFGVDVAKIVTMKDGTPKRSFVQLVMGNDGTDIIADYGISLEEVMDPLHEWIYGKYVAS